MKKTLILLLAIAALATSGAGCKKKTKPVEKIKIETLDIEEVSGYRNPAMVKELT